MILDIALSTPAPAKTPRSSRMCWKWKKIANCLLGRGLSALASDFIRFFHLFASHLQRRVCSQQLLRFWIFKGSEKVSTFETEGWKRFLQFGLPAQTSEFFPFPSSLAAWFWDIVSYLHITTCCGHHSQPLRHHSLMEYQDVTRNSFPLSSELRLLEKRKFMLQEASCFPNYKKLNTFFFFCRRIISYYKREWKQETTKKIGRFRVYYTLSSREINSFLLFIPQCHIVTVVFDIFNVKQENCEWKWIGSAQSSYIFRYEQAS